MDKQKIIQNLKTGHQEMLNTIRKLSKEQMEREKIMGDWSVRDILAHLSAWSIEATKKINRVLQNKPTWPKLYYKKEGEDKFNRREIAKRKKESLENIIREWNDSFQAEMTKLEELSEKEWLHQSDNDKWEDGSPVTVFSLCGYKYQGENHEAAHARQIRKHFNLHLQGRKQEANSNRYGIGKRPRIVDKITLWRHFVKDLS